MTKTSLLRSVGLWFPSLVGRAKDKIDERKLSSWKLLDDFRRRLAKAQAAVPAREKRSGGPQRLLLEKDYFSLMLFGLFNPVLDSLRGLCAASHLKRVQEDVCIRPVSLGSFSEGQGVFDPEWLKQVFLELAGEIPTSRNSANSASHLFSASATSGAWKSSKSFHSQPRIARRASPGGRIS